MSLAPDYVWKGRYKDWLVQYTNLPTPTDIRKKWCFGLPLLHDDGTPMPDQDIELYIADALGNVEKRLGTSLKPIKILCNPDPSLVKGQDYDAAEPPYDYEYRSQAHNWSFIQLRKRPVLHVDRWVMKFPNGQQIFDFPKDWIKLYNRTGQVQLVPYAGFATVVSTYPIFAGFLGANIPQLIWIDYTAGFEEIPQDIHGIIARIATVTTLGIAGDANLAGISSLSTSVDGLSESLSTTASATSATYGAHIMQYQKEIDKFWDAKDGDGKGRHMGFRITGV